MVRFALSDSQDQSAAVWIMTFLLLSYTTLTTLVRGYVKSKMMGLDDGAAGLMQLIAFGHVVCMVYALLHGFAKTQPQTAEEVVELEYGTTLQASIVLYILALATAKVAVVLFLRRAFRRANHTYAMALCNTAIAAVSLWGIGAAVGVSVGCGPEHIWQAPQSTTCNGNTRWLIVAALDGATEIGILIVAIWLVRQLQMKWTQKATVIAAFAWRLPLAVMIVYHYRSYRNALRSSDADIAITKIVIWEQVGICYSLLSITWPFSKSFINGFDTAPLEAISTFGSGAVASRTGGKRESRGCTADGRPWDTTVARSMAACTRSTTLKGDDESFGSQGDLIIREHHEVAVTWDDDDRASSNGPQKSTRQTSL